jgi:hypothetical protein
MQMMLEKAYNANGFVTKCPSVPKKFNSKLVLIVSETVTDVPQTFPHLVSGIIIDYIIDKTRLLQQE